MGPHRLLASLLALVLVACGASLAFASDDADSCGQHRLARRATPPPGHDPGHKAPAPDPVQDEDDGSASGSEPPTPEPAPVPAPIVEAVEAPQVDEPATGDGTSSGQTGCHEEPAGDSGQAEDDASASRAGSTRTRDPNRGGRGPDRFIGDAGRNAFFGGAGDDYLDGAGGADELRGGPDDDILVTGARAARAAKRARRTGDYANGGPGNDVIRARNGRRDHIECGGGRDRVLAERGDTISRNCERVRLG